MGIKGTFCNNVIRYMLTQTHTNSGNTYIVYNYYTSQHQKFIKFTNSSHKIKIGS